MPSPDPIYVRCADRCGWFGYRQRTKFATQTCKDCGAPLEKPEPRVLVAIPPGVVARIQKKGVNAIARQLQSWEPEGGGWETYAQRLRRAMKRGRIDEVFLDLLELVL